MISVFQIGSRQYNVTLGSRLRLEKLDVKKGEVWTSKEVLAIQSDKGDLELGAPFVKNAQVKVRVVRHGKAKKVLILKKKRRKGYRRTLGHRQSFTEVFVEALADSKGQWLEVKKSATKKVASSKKTTSSKTPVKVASKTDSKKTTKTVSKKTTVKSKKQVNKK